MKYEAELKFLQQLFHRCSLQCLLIETNSFDIWKIDKGLRTLLGDELEYDRRFIDYYVQTLQPETIYHATDQYLCSYLYFMLPDTDGKLALVAGPYLTVELTHQQLLEQTEYWGVQPQDFPRLEHFYSTLPTLLSANPLLIALYTFAEQIWGAEDSLAVIDVNLKVSEDMNLFRPDAASLGPDAAELNMQMLEQRYFSENELIQFVSQGLTHKIEQIMVNFSSLSFELRTADPVRNLKNYAIVMNTLLRKAAEQGGVHPYYLDKTSSRFARRIEALSSTREAQQIMNEIPKSYCRLVREHSTRQYSLPVQRMIIYIEENPQEELSLSSLAEMQKMNPSYLSALFKRETGQTVTDFVNRTRMELAARLLSSSKLQVQTIAHHCGFSDVSYFTKLFRKHTGTTPKAYRQERSANHS